MSKSLLTKIIHCLYVCQPGVLAQAADLQAPENDAELQQLHARWADRDSSAAALAVDHQAILDRIKNAIASAWSLVIKPAPAGLPAAQITDPLYRLWAGISIMAKSLYDIAAAAEQLPGQHSTAPSHTACGHSWKATVFAINTAHMVMNAALQEQPPSLSASAGGASHTTPPLDSIVRCLDHALYEQQLVPCFTAQLQATAGQLSTTEQQQVPLDLHSDSQILEDLSHLELEPSLQHEQHTHFNRLQSQTPATELKPFIDFDTSLPGADEPLESGLESSSNQQQLNATEAPDKLVPFTDFDASLQGADQLLELDMASQDSTTPADAPSNSSPAAATRATAHGREPLGNAGPSTSVNPQEGDSSALSQAMQHFVECAGRMAVAEQVQESMTGVSSNLQQVVTTHPHEQETVCFEWMHEPALQQALHLPDGLGPPAVISAQVGHQLQPRNLTLFARPVHTCDGFDRTL